MSKTIADRILERQVEEMSKVEKLEIGAAFSRVKRELADIRSNVNNEITADMLTGLVNDLYLIQAVEQDTCIFRGCVRVVFVDSLSALNLMIRLTDKTAYDATLTVDIDSEVIYINEASALAANLNKLHDLGITLHTVIETEYSIEDKGLCRIISEFVRDAADEEMMDLF